MYLKNTAETWWLHVLLSKLLVKSERTEWCVDTVTENNKLAAAVCDSKISSKRLRTFWHSSCENPEKQTNAQKKYQKWVNHQRRHRKSVQVWKKEKKPKNSNAKQWLWQCGSVSPAWKFRFLQAQKCEHLGKWTLLSFSLSLLKFWSQNYIKKNKKIYK